MNKTKVLHISTPSTWRGGEQQLAYLAEGAETHQAFVYCPQNSELKQRIKIDTKKVFAFKSKSTLGRVNELKKQLLKNEYQFLHSHDAKSHTIALMASLLSGKSTPLVVHRRVDFALKKGRVKTWKYKHDLVSKVISVSKAIDNMVAAVVENNKRKVVYSGVNSSLINLNSTFFKQESSDTFNFLSVAALADHKDIPNLLSAFKIISDKYNITKLFIAGDGPNRPQVESLINDLSLGDDVVLLGYREDIKEIIASADAFVLASKTEGLGTSIIDAMFAKLPIAVTNAGGIPELIQNQHNGLLCETENAEALAKNMEAIYLNSEMANKLAIQAQKDAEKFSHLNMIKEIEDVYSSLLK